MMIASLETINKRIASRGSYRINVDVTPDAFNSRGRRDHYRKGFSQVLTLCRSLRTAKADYTVSWDTLENGVLILFTIPKRNSVRTKRVHAAKRVTNYPIERPTLAKCDSEITKYKTIAIRMLTSSERDHTTHASIIDGQKWYRSRLKHRAIGHALARWFAEDTNGCKPDYKRLDDIFGFAVRRGSQLPTHYSGDYKLFLTNQARQMHCGENEVAFYAPHRDVSKEGLHDALAELQYWSDMRSLVATEGQ